MIPQLSAVKYDKQQFPHSTLSHAIHQSYIPLYNPSTQFPHNQIFATSCRTSTERKTPSRKISNQYIGNPVIIARTPRYKSLPLPYRSPSILPPTPFRISNSLPSHLQHPLTLPNSPPLKTYRPLYPYTSSARSIYPVFIQTRSVLLLLLLLTPQSPTFAVSRLLVRGGGSGGDGSRKRRV